jgi:hypothetical protein
MELYGPLSWPDPRTQMEIDLVDHPIASNQKIIGHLKTAALGSGFWRKPLSLQVRRRRGSG